MVTFTELWLFDKTVMTYIFTQLDEPIHFYSVRRANSFSRSNWFNISLVDTEIPEPISPIISTRTDAIFEMMIAIYISDRDFSLC